MKFCKKYEEYMKAQGKKKLPGVGFKKLKKILKRCTKQPHHLDAALLTDLNLNNHTCPQHCSGSLSLFHHFCLDLVNFIGILLICELINIQLYPGMFGSKMTALLFVLLLISASLLAYNCFKAEDICIIMGVVQI